MIVDRIVETCIEVPVIREKAVPMYDREEIIKEVPIEKIVPSIEFR